MTVSSVWVVIQTMGVNKISQGERIKWARAQGWNFAEQKCLRRQHGGKSTPRGKLRMCFKNSSRKTRRQQFAEANIGELKKWGCAKLLNVAKKSSKIRAEDTSDGFGIRRSLVRLVRRGSEECWHRRGWRIGDKKYKQFSSSPRHLALNGWRCIG